MIARLTVFACAFMVALTGMAAARARTISLDQAYDRTLSSDQSIRIAYTEILKAKLLPWSALTKFGPKINAGVSYNHVETTTQYYDNPNLAILDAQNANLSLNQPLIDFTFFPAFKLGKLTVQSNRLQYQLTIRNVLFGVAKAYYEVLKQQQIVLLDKNTLELASSQLQLSQNQYDAGAVSKVDILRAQSSVEGARQVLIVDQNILESDRNTLANTLNLHGGERAFEVEQPADAVGHVGSFEENLAEAYAGREDYKISAIAIQQSREQKNQVLGQYAPTAGVQFTQNWADSREGPGSQAWAGLVSVQVPIFTGGQREIDLRNARLNIDESKVNFETTQKTVETDVNTTWLQVETLRQTIVSVKAQVKADEQNYQDLQNQYEAGAATSLDTQNALIQLAKSRTNLVTQTYQYQVVRRDLERAIAVFQNQRVKKIRIP
ncbi:MAG: TolC family protein [Verrucomicrobiota bacterium]